MDKTDLRILRRKITIDKLPEGVARNDRHLQICDRDIAGTRLRLRRTRNPETREQSFVLQKRDGETTDELVISLMVLNEAEYDVLAECDAVQTRKNRYFTSIGGRDYAVDVYLGEREGDIECRTTFGSREEMESFVWPSFEDRL